MRQDLLQAIHIKLMPSTLLLGLLLAISIVACTIIVTLPIVLHMKLVVIALILLTNAYYILRDVLLMLPWSWQLLEVDSKGKLTLANKLGQQMQPILADTTFVNAKLTILNFKRDGLKLPLPPVVLLASAENADTLRRLRVWLHWALPSTRPSVTQNQDDLLESD